MQSTAGHTLSFRPLTETVGAEVIGFDPTDVTSTDRIALRDAWARYHVLVIREVPLTEEMLIDLGRSLGPVRGVAASGYTSPLAQHAEIMVISNIRENGQPLGLLPDGEMDWHFDGLHQATPYAGAALHAIEIPASGGETRFLNMCAVYRSLPEDIRARIDGLTAVSVYDYSSTSRDAKVRDASAARAVHPMVRVHEVSGEKALFVCRLMTEQIAELTETASNALLEELFGYIERFPAFYEHRWRVGDTVIWDNRCVTHARNDFDPNQRRYLKRVTILPEP